MGATSVTGVSKQANKLPKVKIKLDPFEIHDYQKIKEISHCPTCNHKLYWTINKNYEDDRFCVASCCGMHYYMVPETVRILPVAEADVKKLDSKYAENIENQLVDEDFFRELQSL